MHARPVLGLLDKALLDGIAEDIEKPLNLRPLLFGDHGRVVAPVEDRSPPAGEAVDLARQLGFQVPHETGQLLAVFDDQEEMEVVGQHAGGTKPHLIPLLYPSQDAEEQVVERGSGPEEIAPLDGPTGDEDESR
jgi:hypothetical protein